MGSQELEERLAQAWRWRELGSPHESGGHEIVAADRHGRLLSWAPGSLALYDGSRWEALPADELGARGQPRQIVAAGEGWLVFTEQKRCVQLAQDGTVWDLPLPAAAHALPLRALDDGRVFAVTQEGLYEFQGRAFTLALPVPPGHTLALEADPQGRLVATTTSGAFVQSGAHFEALELPAGVREPPRYVRVAKVEDRLWFFPGRQASGLPILDFAEGRFASWPAEVFCESVVNLPDGSLVLSDRHGGLRVRRGGAWRDVERFEALDDLLSDLLPGSGGRILARTGSGRLWMCDLASERWRVLTPDWDEGRSATNSLCLARAGGVWVGTNRGIHRWDGERFVDRFTEVLGVELLAVTALREDIRGDLWVGSGSAFDGALRFDGKTWERVLDPIGPYAVHGIELSADGSLWFLLLGSLGLREGAGGLLRFDGTEWRRFTTADGLPDDRCYALCASASGSLVVATDRGLARLQGERWSVIPESPTKALRVLTETRDGTLWAAGGIRTAGLRPILGPPLEPPEGLSHLRVGALLDSDQGLWIAAQQGLFQLRGSLLHALSDEHGALRNFWPMLEAPDESFYLGSLGRGIVRYRPDDGEGPRISSLRVAIDEGGEDYVLRWRAMDPWETTPEAEVTSRWRIDGGSWSTLLRDGELRLKGLSPGPHRIEVEAYDLAGNTNSTPARVDFEVPAPLFARPPVLVVLGTVLGALFWLGFVGWRHKRLHHQARAHERAQLAASERHYRAIVEHARLLFASTDADGRVTYLSPTSARFFAHGDQAAPLHLADLVESVEGPARKDAESLLQTLEQPRTHSLELPFARGDGRVAWLFLTLSPRHGLEGLLEGFDLVALDLSAHKESELEREELGKQLRQAQQLEAVGQLAAGVAHDFNNLLTVIAGNVELLNGEPFASTPVVEQRLSEILAAARQAAALTRDLLAFSRLQVLAPQVLDLNRVVRALLPMLERVIPESIAIVLDLAEGLPPVELDEGRIHQVLLNLAINARDAMPGGGRLRLATRACLPDEAFMRRHPEMLAGLQVVLEVTDTGHGMEEGILARVFEPFFTTKGPGRGTGLGLSTVHGIVKQSGGSILVDSAPARGSRFTIYFPATSKELPGPLPAHSEARFARANETLLLCEDDAGVRHLLHAALQRAGYLVLVAGRPSEAMRLAREHVGAIQLLVTDVVLPEHDGRELARRFSSVHPEARVLYVSGYSLNVIDHEGVLEPGLEFLEKPFRTAELLERVAEILGTTKADLSG